MTSFTVIDMTCGACASRISQALKQANLPPELGIDIDTESREVRLVKGASPYAAELVRNAIEAEGYSPRVSKPNGATAAASHAKGCCCVSSRTQKLDVNQKTISKIPS
jgi:copper chaperone